MARRRRGGNVSLPWERRGSWRQLLSGSRWKAVLALVLLFGAGALVWSSADRNRRERETHVAIAEVRRAIVRFRAEVGRCPHSTTELVHPPRSRTRYLREMPKDGWDRQLWVRCPSQVDPDDFTVLSAGPSGSFFVDDNVQ